MRHATAAAIAAIAAGLVAIVPAPAASRAAHGARPAGPAPARGRSCLPPRARVLARNSSLGIYETRPASPGAPRGILACVAGHSGHMTLLAATRLNARTSLRSFELAGRVAAYLETQFGVDAGTTKLVVVDVGARRVLHSIQAGSYSAVGLTTREDVSRFFVTARGAVAWSATREEHRRPVGAAVFAAPREGRPAPLDSGPAIDAASLALSGATLTWTDGGVQRTAPIP